MVDLYYPDALRRPAVVWIEMEFVSEGRPWRHRWPPVP